MLETSSPASQNFRPLPEVLWLYSLLRGLSEVRFTCKTSHLLHSYKKKNIKKI